MITRPEPHQDEPADKLLFLPGAMGNIELWKPVSDRLAHPGTRRFVSWPGFGGAPSDPRVRSLDDLVASVVDEIDGPVDLLAQSMGGVIAVLATLRRREHVRHLVLSVTSGGIDVEALGGADWRPLLLSQSPEMPRWFIDERRDLTSDLQTLDMPVLLLWGDADPISPVAAGRRLAELIPTATLLIVEGGTHDLVSDRAAELAPHIDRHLRT